MSILDQPNKPNRPHSPPLMTDHKYTGKKTTYNEHHLLMQGKENQSKHIDYQKIMEQTRSQRSYKWNS